MSKSHESLARLARVLADPGGRIGMGEHAALRRMNPLEPGAAAMTVCRLLADEAPLEDDRLLLRWCVIIHALALARGAHDRRSEIGKILWGMNYKEQRINQLLVADFDNLSQLVPRLARRVRASSTSLNFEPLLRLVLAAGINKTEAERARLDIARSCARHQPKN